MDDLGDVDFTYQTQAEYDFDFGQQGPVTQQFEMDNENPVQPQQGPVVESGQSVYNPINFQSADINQVEDWFEQDGLKDDYGYIWDTLSESDKKKIYSIKDKLNIDSVMQQYGMSGSSDDVDNLIKGGRFRIVDTEKETKGIEKRESEWLKEFYPELS